MYRKVLIAFVAVFLDTVSITVQGLVAFFILIVSLLLQNSRQPYKHHTLNKLETYAIITAGTTIYCGLFYLTESLAELVNIFLFIIILLSNMLFVVYWASNMFKALAFKFLNMIWQRKTARV